jgi:thiamine biosynthesis protein ThiI
MDKLEIIELAQQIGTYDLSIEPYKDPCSLHARNPSTWAHIDAVLTLERSVNIDSIITETLERHVEKVIV